MALDDAGDDVREVSVRLDADEFAGLDQGGDHRPVLTCVDGVRARPPEDVGGIGGYERFLAIMSATLPESFRPESTKLGIKYSFC